MHDDCEHGTFEGMSRDYQIRLWLVIVVNAAMFVTEMVAGHTAGSKALQADALDFLADAVTYAISFWAIGRSVATKSKVALLKAGSLFAMGGWVVGSTMWQFFVLGVPEAQVMGLIGVLAFAANLFTVLLLMAYRNGDANIRSVWLCSRNDMLGNVAVIAASVAVWQLASAWPDLIVAIIMGGLFFWSSIAILRQALAEWREGTVEHSHP